MRNEEEAFEDYASPLGLDLTVPKLGDYRSGMTLMAWRAFQAGAAYQRTQAQPAEALVEALEEITTYPGSGEESELRRIARAALAAYRAQQENPNE